MRLFFLLINAVFLFHQISTTEKVYKLKLLANFTGPIIGLKIGTPEQVFYAQLNPLFNDIMVVSDKCGRSITDCPLYCRDEHLLNAYCSPLCRPITEQNRPVYCLPPDPDPNYYLPEKSKTYKKAKSKSAWKTELFENRPFAGIFAEDVAALFDHAGNRMDVESVVFRSALMVDHSFFYLPSTQNFDAVVGFSPGRPNSSNNTQSFFYKLYKQNLIDQPIVTIKHFGFNMKIGTEDRTNCMEAVYLNVAEDEDFGWVFEADEFEFMGERIERRTRISWDITQALSLFPPFAIKKLKDMGILVMTDYYHVKANSNISVSFKFGKKWLHFNQHEFFLPTKGDLWPAKFDDLGRERRLETEVEWMIGYDVSDFLCQFYDFGNRRLGIARRIG